MARKGTLKLPFLKTGHGSWSTLWEIFRLRDLNSQPTVYKSQGLRRESTLGGLGVLRGPGSDYFTLNAGTAPPFSMNVHLPSAHTRFSISIRFNCTYCSGDRPIACR